MAGTKGHLFNLWEEFINCAIENELSYRLERNLFLGPNFRRVKNIKVEFMFVFLFNGLNGEGPFRETAVIYSFFQVFSMEVWEGGIQSEFYGGYKSSYLTRILATDFESFIPNETMNPKFRNHMEFDKNTFAISISERVGIYTESLHHTEGTRNS